MTPAIEAERCVREWLDRTHLGPTIPRWAQDDLIRDVREAIEDGIAHVTSAHALEPQP